MGSTQIFYTLEALVFDEKKGLWSDDTVRQRISFQLPVTANGAIDFNMIMSDMVDVCIQQLQENKTEVTEEEKDE